MDERTLRHIGFIVDGNRRWAKAHGLPSYEGHLAGYNTLKDIALASFERGVTYMSAYVFSTENWKRSKDEVKRLMGLMLNVLTNDLPLFDEHNVRLRVIGSHEGVDAKLLEAIRAAEESTRQNTAGTLLLYFNYGGQLEIAEAVKKIVQSKASVDTITPELIAANLYAPEVPSCDLIVRTSGEQRLSNFMLWQSAYSELMFLDKNWPELTIDDVDEIITEFKSRKRRFGG